MLLNLLYNFVARAIEIGTAHAWLPFSLFRGFLALCFLRRNLGPEMIR
jgi:hypothetical protein